MARTLIYSLFALGGPAHLSTTLVTPILARASWGVLVDAVVGSRTRAYFREKLNKVMAPMLTNRDAVPSVILPIGALGIGSPGNHVCPSGVLGSPVPTGSGSVSSFGANLLMEATTTSCKASPERTNCNQSHLAAIASTKISATESPLIGVTGGRSLFKGDKPTETLTDEVNLGGHRELTPSGVMPRAVDAAPRLFSALYFTRSEVPV